MRNIGFLGLVVAVWAAGSVWAATELLQGGQVALIEDGKPVEWKQAVTVFETGSYAYRFSFVYDGAQKFDSLILKKPSEAVAFTLNGKPIPLPVEQGVFYETVPGIPVSMLKPGTNTLYCESFVGASIRAKKRKHLDEVHTEISIEKAGISLKGMTAKDLALQTGPILGWAGERFFTVSCRINMMAEMRLEAGGKSLVSPAGAMHQFKLEGLEPDTDYAYTLKARLPDSETWTTVSESNMVKTYPAEGEFEFVIMGDSRSRPNDWARVAKAVEAYRPRFCAFVGDMIMRGFLDHLWDDNFFSRGRGFLATVPFYPVMGNHEEKSVLFPRLFATPSGSSDWEQRIGPVHLIGIDGEQEWGGESEKARWLEGVLAGSDAKFIFLCTHFPAWTSGKHGIYKKGRLKDKQINAAREVILPLMAKYKATAMVGGHDHCYERSEPPGGVTVLISGGAGAPLNEKVEGAAVLNPYSAAFFAKHHFCVFNVSGDQCELKALTPEGRVLDTRTWKARKK